MTYEVKGYELTPQQRSPRDAFFANASEASKLFDELGYSKTPMPEFRTFIDSLFDNGTIVFSGNERYESDMVRASQNVTKRPFGIEVSTLSDNVQLVLYPRMIFSPSENDIATAEEMELTMRRDGPQAMIYPLDGIDSERDRTADNAANLLFVGHLIDALLVGKYPRDRDSHSPEFTGVLRRAATDVRTFVGRLSPEQKATLSTRIARIGDMDDKQLAEYAINYSSFRVEDMREHGLLASEGEIYKKEDRPGRTREEAVSEKKEYLRLSDRDLPERPQGVDGVPSLPWREYGTDRYNRDHQLLGRYDYQDTRLTVDYRLDSTHMPATYGFFDTIEIITRNVGGEIDQHIILGQEVNREKEGEAMSVMFFGGEIPEGFVYPIIAAGEFTFQDTALRAALEELINDPGVKKAEIGKVLRDTLSLDTQGELQRVPSKE